MSEDRYDAEKTAIVEEDAAEDRSLRADEEAEVAEEQAANPAPRLTRRAVLAAIALASAPTPQQVSFREEPDASVDLGMATDMPGFHAWCGLLGAEPAWIRHQPYPLDAAVPEFEIWSAVIWGQWGGWRVYVRGSAPTPPAAADEPLPAETVTALSEVAEEREAPR